MEMSGQECFVQTVLVNNKILIYLCLNITSNTCVLITLVYCFYKNTTCIPTTIIFSYGNTCMYVLCGHCQCTINGQVKYFKYNCSLRLEHLKNKTLVIKWTSSYSTQHYICLSHKQHRL